jgi:hypothetical protein
MSNLNPFELRLELLKMAKDMLVEEYYGKKEQVSNDWQVRVESARHAGAVPPEHPTMPTYPTEADVVAKATQLNSFVSQIPHAALEKTSKKST